MRFTTADIRLADDFSTRLSRACAQMKDGVPISRALYTSGISRSNFTTLIRSLRASPVVPSSGETVDCPLWTDELVTDICGKAGVYVPVDFIQSLARVEDECLDEDEKRIIHFFYEEGKTMEETARLAGLDDSNAARCRNRALAKLRQHKDELVKGTDYVDRYSELQRLYAERTQELSWMAQGISYLKSIGKDVTIDDAGLGDEAKAFYRKNGVRALSDLMSIAPAELIRALTESARPEETHSRLPDDTLLSDLDFTRQSVAAFSQMGIRTVGDILSLGDDEVMTLSEERRRDVLRLYRMLILR